MATDIQARESGSNAIVIALVAIVLIACIGGFLYFNSGVPTGTTVINSGPNPPASNTTIINPPAQNPPVVNVNPASPPAAPAPAAAPSKSDAPSSDSSGKAPASSP